MCLTGKKLLIFENYINYFFIDVLFTIYFNFISLFSLNHNFFNGVCYQIKFRVMYLIEFFYCITCFRNYIVRYISMSLNFTLSRNEKLEQQVTLVEKT